MLYYLPGAGQQSQLQLGSVWLISPDWGGEVQDVVGAQSKGLSLGFEKLEGLLQGMTFVLELKDG